MRCASRAAIADRRAAIASSASSHEAGSKRPAPFGPTRRSGRDKRSVE
jgi:hypothetical protein